MKTKLYLAAVASLATFLSGCAGPSKFAEIVRSADTAHKEIDAEFSGWNAHFKYHSKPTGTNSASVTFTPETVIKVRQP